MQLAQPTSRSTKDRHSTGTCLSSEAVEGAVAGAPRVSVSERRGLLVLSVLMLHAVLLQMRRRVVL